jgi:hypothetical protein
MPPDRKSLFADVRREPDGATTWVGRAGDEYLVTGVARDGRRIRQWCATWVHASGWNVWRGTRWLVRHGVRKALARIRN